MYDRDKYFMPKEKDKKYLKEILCTSDESCLQEDVNFGTLGTILINYKRIHNMI